MAKETNVMKQEPLVSILMNCFNGKKFLRQAIESVLAQTYQNWEIIFWDNQSTDKSAVIFKEYNDPRLKYYYAPKHTWLYEARNYAIENASGEFIAFLDVDDLWLPEKLEKQILLFQDPEVGFACGNYWLKSEKKKKSWKALKGSIPAGWVLNDLLKSYFVGLLTLMVRRTALESLDYPCDPRYHVMGDQDLVVRLSFNWKLGSIQEPIAICRKHESNELVKHRTKHVKELENWIKEMSQVEAIKSSSNFHYIKINYTYQKAIDQILLADKKGAFLLSHSLPWSVLKFRLWVIMLVPKFILEKLKSN